MKLKIIKTQKLVVTTFVTLSMFAFSCMSDKLINEHIEEQTKKNYSVSYEEALAEVNAILKFMNNENGNFIKSSKKRKIANYYKTDVKSISLKTIEEGEEETENDFFFYVFNFEDNEGFAIISGDSRITSVLAVTEYGNLEQGSEINYASMAYFLDGLLGLIEYMDINEFLDDGSGPPYHYEYTPWEEEVIGSKIGSKWHQGNPYNNECPYIGGIRAFAGCVTVAVGQIMYYHGWPQWYNGYQFDWEDMKQPLGPPNFTGTGMVARLIQQIGLPQNLNVSYSTEEGSSAYADNVPRTFVNMGYASGGTLSPYNYNQLYTEIANNRPVLVRGNSLMIKKPKTFGGYTITYSGGHAWVIDAILKRSRVKKLFWNGKLVSQTSEIIWLVNCNWGQHDSNNNGWYYSGVFNENAGPVLKVHGEEGNYQYNLEMITGIRKN